MLLRALVIPFLLAPAASTEQYTTGPVTYWIESTGDLGRFTDDEIRLLEKLNRRERRYLRRADRIVTPDRFDLPEVAYSPLPQEYPEAIGQPKVLVVHKPSQVFGAYEDGRLVRWGPVSTGRQGSETPDGLFHLTWRSKGHTSSIDDSWYMPWYFNFHHLRGLAFHEYRLPGRPASHACVRLLHRDAKWLYEWGESWTLAGDEIEQPGTPVLIVGHYDFSSEPPWLTTEYWANLPVYLPGPEQYLEPDALASR